MRHLSRLLTRQLEIPDFLRQAESAVNGLACTQLEHLIDRTELKKSGAFFSSPELSSQVADELRSYSVRSRTTIIDPACGAGNLLIAAAKKLPLEATLSGTLNTWGTILAGFDIHEEFIQATHLRLALYACYRGAKFDISDNCPLSHFFPNIRKGDGTKEIEFFRSKSCHILLNPPYATVRAPKSCEWISGNVNQAAIFLIECISKVKSKTRITAILPDVLRSGTRYEKWRSQIENQSTVKKIQSVGNFITADVDVFVLDLEVGGHSLGLEPGNTWWKKTESKSIDDAFTVSVGAVVKHRVKLGDEPAPYIHAKGLPYWGEIKCPMETINFSGRLETPPFVVIRRTSSPSDKKRAIATIVTGKQRVAIDNHLIICSPRDGGISECKKLIKSLKCESTSSHLNDRIRCRHLTVGVIRDIPFQ